MEVLTPRFVKSPDYTNTTATPTSVLISSNIDADPTTDIWSVSTAYTATTDTVNYMHTTGRDAGIWKQYQCQTSNTGNEPPEYGVDTYWLDLGAINRYKMFDYYVSTTTLKASSGNIVIKLLCSYISSIAFINTKANSIDIRAWDLRDCADYDSGTGLSTAYTDPTDSGDITVLDEIDLHNPVTNYFDYFFAPYDYVRDIATPSNDSFALYKDLVVEITFNNFDTPEDIYCGACIPGIMYEIGSSQNGVDTGIQDYSKKVTDDTFGETYLQVGNYKDKMDIELLVENELKNQVNMILRQIRATPTLFQGNQNDTEYDDLIVFGFLQDWTVTHKSSKYSEVNLEIEGLI